jgi:hypothetical protein
MPDVADCNTAAPPCEELALSQAAPGDARQRNCEQRKTQMTPGDQLYVQYKVARHPGGRHTLMIKRPGEQRYGDPPPGTPLFANLDKTEFNRAVARELASVDGTFEYEDVDDYDSLVPVPARPDD